MKKAVIHTDGANCPSCVHALEHNGKKVEGVKDVVVDPSKREITVSYDDNPGSVELVAELVRRLGYQAEIDWESVTR